MYNISFAFLFASLLFISSCRKENYQQLLRSENNRLASVDEDYTLLYSIYTEGGSVFDLYRDSEGFVSIYKKKSGSESHDIKLTIKDINGKTYPFTTSYMSGYQNRKTNIKDRIKVLKGEIILFEEGKGNTSLNEAIYTIRSERTSVNVYQNKLLPPPSANGKPVPQKRPKTRRIIVLSNQKPGSKLSDTPTTFSIKTTDGSYSFSSDDVAKLSYLEIDSSGDLLSVLTDGVYLFSNEHTREKRGIRNSRCSTGVTEEIIYDINTEAYASGSPVGAGIFSIRRTIDDQIIMYQENAFGPGNSSVNYEITAKSYKIDTSLEYTSKLTFNENIFSSSANQRIDTKLNGLIIVKRNGIVLFDESEEIKKQVINYGLCMADFFQKSELFTDSHHITRRGVGDYFYEMPQNGDPVVIKVKFITSKCPEGFKKLIMNAVKDWEAYAHVEFHFLNDNSNEYAHVRIDVGKGLPDNGIPNYSAHGTLAKMIPNDRHTMRLSVNQYYRIQQGLVTEARVKRSILHEFGHVLGLMHEHQHPNRKFKWNKDAVYKSLPSGATWEDMDRQIFAIVNSPTSSNSGQYDPQSIMNYPFPPLFTFGSSACPPARDEDILELSAGDKAFIAKMYPASYCTKSNPQCTNNNEQKPLHKKKPDYIDTTNEPPGPE